MSRATTTSKIIRYCVVHLDSPTPDTAVWAIEETRQEANRWREERLKLTPSTRLVVRRAKLFLFDT